MMRQVLDLNQSLYDLTRDNSELVSILRDLGFMAVTNPIARNTVGRKMTIPAGCKKMGIPLEKVIESLEERGYKVKV